MNLELLLKRLWLVWYEWKEQGLEVDNETLQLIAVEMVLTRGHRSAACIQAILFPTFCEWLKTWTEGANPAEETSAAMYAAYTRMSRTPEHVPKHDFKVKLNEPDRLSLDVAGDATALDPEHTHRPSGGHLLLPHNVDAPVQQLALLVGLTHLNQAARAAEY